MLRISRNLAAAAAALTLTLGAVQAQEQQQQEQAGEAPVRQTQQPSVEVTATHGDWEVACVDGEAPCIMRQVGSTEGQEVMEVSLRRIEAQQTQQGTVEAVMDIRVPLGVLLREGVSIQIDDGEAQRGAFSICVPNGCLMREPLPNAFVTQLKRGITAKTSFALARNGESQRLEVPISLNGFTAAYDSLEP
ncbi:MAG: invasion associated locus B family protein [Pseudomonadota bacterium]